MNTRTTLIAAFALTLTLGATACGDDGTGPSELPGLEGTWIASSFVIVLLDGSGTFDPVAEGGALRLDVAANGEIVTTTTDAETGELDVDVGILRVLSATRLELQMRANEPTLGLDYVLDGNRLTLSGRFDVDASGDGELRPANLTTVLMKD